MRLHDWAFATAGWRAQHGMEGGERNADSEVVEEVVAGRRRLHHGAQDVRRRRRAVGRVAGAAGGARTRRSTRRSSCSPTTRASRSRCRAARRSPSSPTASSPRWSRRARRPATRTSPIAGGASAVQQYLAAGLLDELQLHIVPVVLGGGERLLEDVGDPRWSRSRSSPRRRSRT